MRVLVGSIIGPFEDASALPQPQRSQVLDPHDYRAAQDYGRLLRNAGAQGVVFQSVRHPDGTCIGAFRPRAVGRPHQERHLKSAGTASG
jgi:hypothetical protein